MFSVHTLSIVFEIIIVILGLGLVVFKKNFIGLGIALTYGIYAFYDIAKFTYSNISQCSLYGLFFIATISMLLVVVGIYRKS